MFKNAIQIAGIIDQAEANMLMASGIGFLGFPLRLPVNKEDLGEKDAARIIRTIKFPHHAVLITYLAKAKDVIDFCNDLGAGIVQLHGPVKVRELQKIKSSAPQIKIIKSLIVSGDNRDQLLSDVNQYSEFVDAFITDTFDPETGASGATGKTHDWNISRLLVERSPKPVILAGGVTPENVREAIVTVRPAGVDAHTGVESPDGRKYPEKVRRFVEEAKIGFAMLADTEPVEIPVNGVLDLHTFLPREVKELVPDYLKACREKGIYSVRIIHGKGTGTLRKIVQSILSRLPEVESFHTAESSGGGWGATSVVLKHIVKYPEFPNSGE